MSKKISDLCVAVDQYVDKEGQQKTKYKKIGIEIYDDEKNKNYILLDRDVNLAGFPNLSGKTISTTVLVSKFEQKEQNSESDGITEFTEPATSVF
ncbi:hypothetical protein [Treponema pedis]|uniref:hypothetical protein n=1 Tax=Treponema pedis TaxID=409322 RepID=UPI00041F1E3D|nr:hypothetical protein [Treponema pedis]